MLSLFRSSLEIPLRIHWEPQASARRGPRGASPCGVPPVTGAAHAMGHVEALRSHVDAADRGTLGTTESP